MNARRRASLFEPSPPAAPLLAWLDVPPPPWARSATVILCALLASRIAAGASGVAGAAIGALGATLVSLGEPTAGDLACGLATAWLVGAAGLSALALDADHFAEPFVAQDSGQRALLVLRCLVFFVVLARVRNPARTAFVWLAAALMVVPLVMRGALLPSVVAMVAIAHRFGERHGDPLPRWTLVFAAVCLGAWIPARGPRPAPPDATTPDERVALWRARGNLFRAHAAALDWARTEAVPGRAHLALAELDHDLGDTDKARKVLAKIAARATDPAVRDAADRDARAWSAPP